MRLLDDLNIFQNSFRNRVFTVRVGLLLIFITVGVGRLLRLITVGVGVLVIIQRIVVMHIHQVSVGIVPGREYLETYPAELRSASTALDMITTC